MLFDLAQVGPANAYKLLVSTVVPRPIAWVVTQSPDGVLNAAPFSFFNAFSSDPPIVGIGVGLRRTGEPKDTALNIEAIGQFVVNLVSEELAQQMNVTAIDYDYGVDELREAGLATAASSKVKPPRIAAAVAIECELFQTIRLERGNSIILGKAVAIHVPDVAVLDAEKCAIDTPALHLIGRMHGTGTYARTTDRFEMPRLPKPSTS